MVELLCWVELGKVELLVPWRSIVEDGGVSLATHFLPKEMKRDLVLFSRQP